MATYIAGVPEAEWNRLQKLPKRALMAVDIPNESWRDDMSNYMLREDGAILAPAMSIELGWLDGQGGVSWLRAS